MSPVLVAVVLAAPVLAVAVIQWRVVVRLRRTRQTRETE